MTEDNKKDILDDVLADSVMASVEEVAVLEMEAIKQKNTWQTRKATMRPFKELDKKTQNARIAAMTLGGLMSLYTFLYFLHICFNGGLEHTRFWPVFGNFFLYFIPLMIPFIFQFRVNSYTMLYYFIYIFFATFLGAVINLYDMLDPYYDKVMHVFVGIVGCSLGLLILQKSKDLDKMKTLNICLFIFGISMIWSVFHEIFEFTVDNLLGQTAQGQWMETVHPETGEIFMTISVWDTMWDFISAFIGGIAFCIVFAIHKATGKNLLMQSMLDGFAKDENQFRTELQNTQEEVKEAE